MTGGLASGCVTAKHLAPAQQPKKNDDRVRKALTSVQGNSKQRDLAKMETVPSRQHVTSDDESE